MRLRRDFGALLGLIGAHALLHQATRERDGNGKIVATVEHIAHEFVDFMKWAEEQAKAQAEGRAVIEAELAHREKALKDAERGRDRVRRARTSRR